MSATLLGCHCMIDPTGEARMTDADYARKLDELDRLLNDPDVPMEPSRVWSLLAEIAQRDVLAPRWVAD
jgi:hypothetical protein